MSTARKLFISAIACVTWAAGPAVADSDHGFTRMFVFGDSLSDPGNKFAVTGETAHPPFSPIPDAAYGVGGHHFSDGKTWVEVLAQKMELTEWAKPAYRDPAFGNYAYAGARARNDAIAASTFAQQVWDWSDAHGCTGAPMDDALFVVQFGGNDLRDALNVVLAGGDPSEIIGGAVFGLVANIGQLYKCGARHFLIAGVPNLGVTPAVPAAYREGVAELSAGFNLLVAKGLYDNLPFLRYGYVDLFGFVTGATMAPQSMGFTNVTTPCLSFGVSEGAFCKDRSGHFFWDSIHPTKKAHALLGEIAYGNVPLNN